MSINSEPFPTENFEQWRLSTIGLRNGDISAFAVKTLPYVESYQVPDFTQAPLSEICYTGYRGYLESAEQRIPDWFLDKLVETMGADLRQAVERRSERGMRDKGPLSFFLFGRLDNWFHPSYDEEVRKLLASDLKEERERGLSRKPMQEMTDEERNKEEALIDSRIWERRLNILQLPRARQSLLDYVEYWSEDSTYNRFLEIDQYIDSKIHDHNTILDAGCSRGVMTERLAKEFPDSKVVGFDLYSGPDIGQKRLAEYVRGNILKPPFPDGSFEVVLMSRVLDHFTLDGIGKSVKAISNLLKDGGKAIIGPFFQTQDMRWTNGIFLICEKSLDGLTVVDTLLVRETAMLSY